MHLVSFDPLRTLGLPCAGHFKPEDLFREGDVVRAADCVLFPRSWQLRVLRYAWKLAVFPSDASYELG
jgi:ribosomal protein S6--L-glutamate ligase